MTNARQKFIRIQRRNIEKAKVNYFNTGENALDIHVLKEGVGAYLDTDSMRWIGKER